MPTNPTTITITDQVTVIPTAWAQGINDYVFGLYGVTGSTFTAAAIRNALVALGTAGGTLTGAVNDAATVTVASATTTDIGAAASNNVDISGTTTITGFGTIAAGAVRRGRFTGALTLTHNATSLILPGAANITTAANDRYVAVSLGSGNWLVLDYVKADGTATVSSTALSVPVRQTVLSGPVDTSGLPTFLPATSVNLNLTTQNVSTGVNALVATAAGGAGANGTVDVVGESTTNLTWTGCTANQTNYLFCSISGGVLTPLTPTILQPIEQFGGTPSVTAGQYTFNIQQMTMYLGNGATAPAVNHVKFGECVADASTITSTIAYAYMGQYDSGFTATLPNSGVPVAKNHNIGVTGCLPNMIIECTTAENGYSIGDQIVGPLASSNGTQYQPTNITTTRNVVRFVPNTGAPWLTQNKTTGATAGLTLASWKYKLLAKRGF